MKTPFTMAQYDAQTAYDQRIAATYDADRKVEPLWLAEQNWVEGWLANVPEGSSILDVPFGTGRFATLCRARKLSVHGVDISQAMIDQARKQHGIGLDGFELQTGDATALPFANSSIDRIVCFRLTHLLPDAVLKKVLSEFGRVSRSEVAVQFFSLSPKHPSLLQWIVRQIRRTRCREQKPWSHITNYPHDEPTVLKFADQAGLHLLSRHVVSDATNPGAVLVFVPKRA